MRAHDAAPSGGSEPGRLDNGLQALTYVPLTDVDAEVGQHLLTALGRARIAAYLGPAPQPAAEHPSKQHPSGQHPSGQHPSGQHPSEQGSAGQGSAGSGATQRRLFVASEERVDARTIVVATVRALGTEQPALPSPADPLAGIDTDTAFDALVAGWHVDTVAAVREAERDLNREDAEWRARLLKPQAQDEVWLDDDHYIPPPPPPLPRLAAPTIIAIMVLAMSIVLLGIGSRFGLASDFTFVLGIGGLLLAAGILLSRVRDRHRDEDDDGSAI